MKRYLFPAFLFIFYITFSFDQYTECQTGAQEGQEPAVQTVKTEASEPGMITFSFKDADIRNVLRLIAAKSGINIVYGPEITGMVNMELKDVPWEQALGLVLDLNGFAYQKEGPVIKVLKKEDVSKEPLSTEIFTLNYASAKDMIESVKQILTERGSIKTDARSNTIIVTDVPVNINKIEAVLLKLDTRTPQVLIETRIVEMSDKREKDLGIRWTSLKEYKIKLEDPKRTLTDTFNSLRENTSKETWAFGDAMTGGGGTYIATTPRFGPDYRDPTTIYSYNPLVNYSWNQSGGHAVGGSFGDAEGTGNAVSHLLSDIKSAILSADDFELVISALQSQTDINLVSNPKILTANNETAQIKVVSEYPIPNYTFDTSTSSFSISGFDYKDIGVVFDVTPNISTDGYITMKIDPQVSTLIDEIPFSAGGSTVYIPYIGVKKASAKLIVKSGDTLAIGGMISEDKKNVETKIPLLGDIPVIGRLFRHDSIANTKENVIFFITATVIDEATKRMLEQEGVTNKAVETVKKIDIPRAVPEKKEDIKETNAADKNKGVLVSGKKEGRQSQDAN